MSQDEIVKLVKEKFPKAAQEDSTKALIIPKAMLLEVSDFLKNSELAFDNLHCVTAVDRIEKIELVYIFQSIGKRHTLMVKVSLALDDLKVESLAGIWKSADWLEREVYDLFGVYFLNHPDLRRILTPYNWDVHPLRKDFSRPDFIKKPQY